MVASALIYLSIDSEGNVRQFDIHKMANYKGYTALLGENTDSTGHGDLHEGFDIGWEPKVNNATVVESSPPPKDGAMAGENVWPSDLPGFKETTLEY